MFKEYIYKYISIIFINSFGTILAQLALMGTAFAGASNCTASVGAMTFPTLTGTGASGTSTQGAIHVSCANTPSYITAQNGVPFCLSLIPNGADAAYSSAGVRVLYLNGSPAASQAVKFQFFTNYRGCGGKDNGKNAPTTCPWGSNDAGNYGAGYVDFVFNGKGNGNWLALAKIISAQSLWAGSYSNNFILRLTWNDTQYPDGTPNTTPRTPSGGGGMYLPSELCTNSAPITGSGEYPLTVTATVKNNCSTVTAPSMDFSRHISLADVKQQAGKITVQCGGGVNYQIGVGKGNASRGTPWEGGWRGMECQGGNCGSSVIYYNLYKDAAQTRIWGDIGSAYSQSGKSNGAAQNYDIYANIAPEKTQQSLGLSLPPKPGIYKDAVVVTLQSSVQSQ